MKQFISKSVTMAIAGGALFGVQQASAHGTMVEPPARAYVCAQGNIENPQDPACAAATAESGTLQFYDPYAIAQANANSNHRAVVPDGKLCSADGNWYTGLDLVRDDWTATPIQADANGEFTFRFWATAPHRTKDWIFYVTKPGYNGEALTWDGMEEFARLGDVPLKDVEGLKGGYYDMTVQLPNRSGKHVIYNVWQRSDSGEAFYTCMDVVFPGDNIDSPWQQVDRLQARQDLPAETTISFRLFDEQGGDLDRIQYTLASDMTAQQWAYEFAVAVNAQSTNARIGQLAQNGDIVPQRSATANLIYTNNANYSVVIEKSAPVVSPTPSPTVTPSPTATPTPSITPTPTPGGSCPAPYSANATYQQGDQVTNLGSTYECKIAGWCSSPAYAPGDSIYWQEAWQQTTSSCTTPSATPTVTPSATPSPSVTPSATPTATPSTTPTPGSCSAPVWQAANTYSGGDRVSLDGVLYEARWWTSGTNPAQGSGDWYVWKVISNC